MKRATLMGLAILAGGLFLGCADSFQGIPEVTPKMAQEYGVDQATLARGRGVYMAHCAQCHERVHPGQIDPEFWRSITPHMAVKAQLTEAEEEQVLHYVMVAHATVHGFDPEH